MVMIDWWQDFVSPNSVCNLTRDWQIGLPLRGRPILLITCMITDRVGFKVQGYILLLIMFTFSKKGLQSIKRHEVFSSFIMNLYILFDAIQ